MMPRAGQTLRIGKEASVQFGQPINFRLIRVMDWITYDEWVWLEGYELDQYGDAVEQRKIFVQIAGIRLIEKPVWLPRRRNSRQPAVPRQRISSDALPATVPARAVTRR